MGTRFIFGVRSVGADIESAPTEFRNMQGTGFLANTDCPADGETPPLQTAGRT